MLDFLEEIYIKIRDLLWISVDTPIGSISTADVLDILILGLALFYIIRFISNRRAAALLKGCFLVVGIFIFAGLFNLRALNFVSSNFYQVGILAIIIIFQDDLRSALEKMGGLPSMLGIRMDKQLYTGVSKRETELAIEAITEAVFEMAKTKTGALIVIEQNTKMGDYINANSGTVIDAVISKKLLKNIFFLNSPLHDGALIIRDMRITAAGCKLPLPQIGMNPNLGTRHNAAIGASQKASDAIIIVVSEERGTVSVCINGDLEQGYDKNRLEKMLVGRLIKAREKAQKEAKQQNKHKKQKNGDEASAEYDENKVN